MSDSLLRQYETWECLGDGYPDAWHRETQSADQSNRHPGDGPRLEPPIKDLIRERADYRCLRCGHPYPSGITELHPNGEWTPCDEYCTHGDPARYRPAGEGGEWRYGVPDGHMVSEGLYEYGPEGSLLQRWEAEAQWRILTVHHLDEDKANCRWWNLAALCQRCHLRMQRAVVMGRPYHFEHSEWFKPFAAGFYAFKYLDEDLNFEETMSRLPELLALELRFKQEALF